MASCGSTYTDTDVPAGDPWCWCAREIGHVRYVQEADAHAAYGSLHGV